MFPPDYFADRANADIRQRMDGMVALAEQLARQPLTPEGRACVDGLVEHALGVRRLLESALDVRRLADRQLEFESAPLRLRDLMDEVEARWRPRAAQTGVTLLISYDGDPDACVMADATRLGQVFDGFVGEAVAGARGGAIEASLRAVPESGGLRIYGGVRCARQMDRGPQTLGSRVLRVEQRFGLEPAIGLLLARHILLALGGKPQAEANAGAGETTAFELVLPRAAEAPGPGPDLPARPLHVLVVDDNATNRMVAQALVEMFGCTCECAEDGAEAVSAAAGGRFDLILMDIKMPRMDGIAAARAIRQLDGPAAKAPIVALTANADPDDAASYLAAGMNGVVEKPMKAEQLLRALREALEPGDEVAAA